MVLFRSAQYWDLVTGNVKLSSKLRAVEPLVGRTVHGQVPVVVAPVMCSQVVEVVAFITYSAA